MHATIRRYEGVDQNRASELTGKVNESLVPKLSKLPGFEGYYLIEAGNGVLSSLGLFETAEQADESTKIVAQWIRDENFDSAMPNAPKITSGKVVAHSNGVTVSPLPHAAFTARSAADFASRSDSRALATLASTAHASRRALAEPLSINFAKYATLRL